MKSLAQTIGSALMGACLALASIHAGAQAFPSRQVRITSPFPTGLGPDVAARVAAQYLSRSWGQPVLVEARPGANGFIAVAAFKKLPADGHELLLIGNAHLTINPNLLKNVPYDPEKDFVPVAMLYRASLFFVVATSGPFRGIKDLVEAARAQPGRISYSTPFVGSPPHLGAALLAHQSGTQMLAVHFKETAQMYAAVANGDVHFTIAASGAGIDGLVKAGRLRLLATTSAARQATYPDVPTVAEAGGPADYESGLWVGLFALRGVAEGALQRLSADIAKMLAEPEVKARYRAAGLEASVNTPAEIAALVRTDLRRNAELVRRIGITPE